MLGSPELAAGSDGTDLIDSIFSDSSLLSDEGMSRLKSDRGSLNPGNKIDLIVRYC